MSTHDDTPRPDLLDDDQLLVQLGRALDETDPVPGDAVAMAKAVFELGNADAELAELVFDSLLDEALVVMRTDTATAARSLAFALGGHRVDIELAADGVTLLGQLDPAEPTRVRLDTTTGSTETTADDLGRFRLAVERGSLRLRVFTEDGLIVTTPWIIW
jgi:hypothetical protein